jgi:hypothetical protein
MKNFLLIVGTLLIATGIKAGVWIARNGVPPSWMPSTIGDWIGYIFVGFLLVSFFLSLAWHLYKKMENAQSKADHFKDRMN